MNKSYFPLHLFAVLCLFLFVFLTACTAAPTSTGTPVSISSPSPLLLFTSSPSPTNTAILIFTPTFVPTYTPRPTATPDPAKIILPDSLSWSSDSRWFSYATSDGTIWLMDIGVFDPKPIPGPQIKTPISLRTMWSPVENTLLVYGSSSLPSATGSAVWLVSILGESEWKIRMILEIPPLEQAYFPGEGQITFANWSTDGTQIALVLHGGEAWVYDLESGFQESKISVLETPIARRNGSEFYDGISRLALSPDKARLALEFTCGTCPIPNTSVGVVALHEERKIAILAEDARLVGWSPDGQFITVQSFFNDIFSQYTSDTYNIDPATGELVNLTRSNPNFDPLVDDYKNFQPAEYHTDGFQWGPDGHYLYQTFYGGPFPEIYTPGFVVHSDLETLLLESIPSPNTWYIFPNLAPDGRIAYIEADPAPPETALDTYQLRRVIIDGEVKFEFQPDQNRLASAGVWSPNGLHLALIRPLQSNSVESEIVIWRGLGLDWPNDPTVTPGPTPTAAFVRPAANAPPCIRREGLEESRVNFSQTETDAHEFCVIWIDDYDNETAFRIVLEYGNGDIFVYDVPANTNQLIVPKEGAPRRGESLEQNLRRTSWQITVYAIGPNFGATVGGMAIDIDSFYGIYILPTATPSPP